MKIIFFDYYHPYAGLCNQLYLISNHIHDAYNKKSKIYIHCVNIDILKKKRIPFSKVFDIHVCNQRLSKLLGYSILSETPPDVIESIPKLCIYPVSSIEILSCLQFQKCFINLIPKIQDGYYGLHFRLEIDAIVSYLFEQECYEDFMNRCNLNTLPINFCNNLMELPQVKIYNTHLLDQYFHFIKQFGFDKPWYISTLVGKKDIHNCMIPVLKRLTDFIIKNGGTIIENVQHFEERELNALIDLITLRDATKMVGFEGSTFSEGYCFKVNSINKNRNKEYLFVNGIVDKLSNGIYQSC